MANIVINDIEKDFFKIYHFWYIKLYSFVFKRVNDSNLAEDVVQNTFLKVWERRTLFSEEIKFSSQLFQIARTTLIDELRKLALNRKFQEYEKPFLIKQYVDMEKQLYFKDQLDYVKSIIREMPLMRQKVFFMHKIDELSHKEIACKLSISPKTVENHITLAFKYIRKFYAIH